jgi:hypothetical protein
MHPGPLPLPPEKMPESQQEALRLALDEWAAAAKAQGAKPWLMYLPLNNRIYDGLVRFDSSVPAELRDWKPHDLPNLVERLCREREIAFIDTIAALRAAAEKGTLVYNTIYDTHLNAEGARIVGEVLADSLKTPNVSAP